jgi:very-short-patch-repair endonuclease
MLYSALANALRPYHVVLVAQEIIGPYIADFCIYPSRVVIEVDGPSHQRQEQVAYDAQRTAFLETLGFKVLRFTNLEVETNADEIAARTVAQCSPLELISDSPTPIRIPVAEKREPEIKYVRSGSLSSKSAICAV